MTHSTRSPKDSNMIATTSEPFVHSAEKHHHSLTHSSPRHNPPRQTTQTYGEFVTTSSTEEAKFFSATAA